MKWNSAVRVCKSVTKRICEAYSVRVKIVSLVGYGESGVREERLDSRCQKSKERGDTLRARNESIGTRKEQNF